MPPGSRRLRKFTGTEDCCYRGRRSGLRRASRFLPPEFSSEHREWKGRRGSQPGFVRWPSPRFVTRLPSSGGSSSNALRGFRSVVCAAYSFAHGLRSRTSGPGQVGRDSRQDFPEASAAGRLPCAVSGIPGGGEGVQRLRTGAAHGGGLRAAPVAQAIGVGVPYGWFPSARGTRNSIAPLASTISWEKEPATGIRNDWYFPLRATTSPAGRNFAFAGSVKLTCTSG